MSEGQATTADHQRLADELARARSEIIELNSFIRYIDQATEKARRERNQAQAELAALQESIAGRAAMRFHDVVATALPDDSTGRDIYRLVGKAARRATAIRGKVNK